MLGSVDGLLSTQGSIVGSDAAGSISSTAMELNKPLMTRRIWRMMHEAPLGELVDFDPTEAAGCHADAPLKVLYPAPVLDWRGFSFDLLNRVEVRDHSDSIPGKLFDRLFKR